ncbi:MAG: hypothetical protein QXY90_04935 [Candidatus Anstonellales archaeon]
MRRPRKRCSSTEGIYIPDDEPDDFTFYIPKKDESLYEGYLVDDDGKVVGEARRYDPYSKFGEIMLYDIDSFGFLPGFISKGLRLMSEEDMMSDDRLRKSLETAKYETWKRHNIVDLIAEYDQMCKNREFFETFCKRMYEGVLEKEKRTF